MNKYSSKKLVKQTAIDVWTMMRDTVAISGIPEGHSSLTAYKCHVTRALVQDEDYLGFLGHNHWCSLCAYDAAQKSCFCLSCPLRNAGKACGKRQSPWTRACEAYDMRDVQGFIAAADDLIRIVKEW